MPPDFDFSRRAPLDEFPELMDGPCSREELRAVLRDLSRLNGWLLAYRPTLKWLDELKLERSGLERRREPVRILDVGCGYGDTLRRIERWAGKRKIEVELTGLDLNADAIAIAVEASEGKSRVHWVAADVFDYSGARPHLVVSSLFTHHLEDAWVVEFLRWAERTALMGWFINDLSRAPAPYHLFRWFSRAMRLHPMVQHDGAASIARAFQPRDWRRLCAAAGLAENEFEVRSHKPARLCVSRSKAR